MTGQVVRCHSENANLRILRIIQGDIDIRPPPICNPPLHLWLRRLFNSEGEGGGCIKFGPPNHVRTEFLDAAPMNTRERLRELRAMAFSLRELSYFLPKLDECIISAGCPTRFACYKSGDHLLYSIWCWYWLDDQEEYRTFQEMNGRKF